MKALVLSSGGVDSTTCLAIAVNKYGKENVATLSIYYGQKHEKELQCARDVARYYDVLHYELDLSVVMQYSDCSLLKGSKNEIQHESYAEQLKKTKGEAVSTYVPFRNGLFLSAAASIALSIFPHEEVEVYCGMHADDAAGNAYPDCSQTFTYYMNSALYEGTNKKVKLVSPLVNCTKADVVKIGLGLHAPYHLTWSCYEGGDEACGTCGTCIDRLNAFKVNGVKDPIKYKGDK